MEAAVQLEPEAGSASHGIALEARQQGAGGGLFGWVRTDS